MRRCIASIGVILVASSAWAETSEFDWTGEQEPFLWSDPNGYCWSVTGEPNHPYPSTILDNATFSAANPGLPWNCVLDMTLNINTLWISQSVNFIHANGVTSLQVLTVNEFKIKGAYYFPAPETGFANGTTLKMLRGQIVTPGFPPI